MSDRGISRGETVVFGGIEGTKVTRSGLRNRACVFEIVMR